MLCGNRKTYCIEVFLLAALTLLFISIIFLSCVPPVSRDALIQHLALPKLYLRHGGLYEIPSMPFSYYPMNLDLIYMIPLYFGNDIAPKLIHFTFALLTAWLLFRYLRRRINTNYALFGVVFFLSIPIVVKLSITAYVDLGLVFFSTASLLFILRWMDSKFQLRFLIFSAIFCGLAMGTKYNGLITFLLLTLFVPFLYSRHRENESPGTAMAVAYTLIFLFTALLIFSPWMVRDYLWTGNPIYPLYDSWFNHHSHIARKSIGLFTYRTLVYHEKWWEILLLPLRIFFQGRDGSPQFFDGKLNPFLLILPIFAFSHLKNDSEKIKAEKWIMLVFATLYFTFAFFTSDMRMRYISPIIPPLVILAVFGLERLWRINGSSHSTHARLLARSFAFCSLLAALSLNVFYMVKQFEYVRPFSYLTGEVSRAGYIERYRPEYPAMRYINNRLRSKAHVLFVFVGNRGYYCNRTYLFDMKNSRSRLATLFSTSHDAQKVWSKLKNEGITNFLINIDIFNRWAAETFNASGMELIRVFFRRYLRLVYSKNGYGVFDLVQR